MVNNSTFKTLENLVNTRKGGVYNIRGIVYQAVYSVYRLLSEFSDDVNAHSFFQLEGVEDLDFYRLHNKQSGEFIQLKCLDENLKTSQFINNILPNLLEVYVYSPNARFSIVSNVHSDKNLSELKALKYGKPLSEKATTFWFEKIKTLREDFDEVDLLGFLSNISFERKTQDELLSDIQKLLILKFNIVNANEIRFTQALFYAVLEWSKQKAIIRKVDVYKVIQDVNDDISRGIQNNAVRGGWITQVSFDNIGDDISTKGYFEGKAARPMHIAAGLPIERRLWEKEIMEAIDNFDITVVKSSSGQGKSTLAWRVAQASSQQNYTVYELTEIGVNGVNDVFTFIQSRLKAGLLPLIVIDGLNEDVKGWAYLAEKTQILRGVKFLLTTREEDWFRYGKQNVSRLHLKGVNIELSEGEAQMLFTAFKKQGKIHVNIPHWQIAWEKVRDKKLLIEYVYLLTQGNMIHERLEEQIVCLEKESDSISKIGILRLISIADMLNIKIKTKDLLRFIEHSIGFKNDKDSVLNSLKLEYHIQLEENYWVVGLHPVRSSHIAQILHHTLPYSETLIDLISIIEPSKLFTLIAQISQLPMSLMDRQSFFEDLAIIISKKPYSEIIETINGVYALDAYQHWSDNKKVYDRLSYQGLMIYVIKKSPFNNLPNDSLDSLISYAPHIEDNLKAIEDFDVNKSNTLFFLKKLREELNHKTHKENLSKAGYLHRWFERFDLGFDILRGVMVSDLEQALIEKPIEVLAEVLRSVYTYKPDVYAEFYEKNKDELLCKLQIETETLTADIKNQALEISYFVESEVNAGVNVKKQSVNRVEIFANCLPLIQEFDVAGLYFPTPLVTAYLKYDDSILKTTQSGWLQFDNFVTTANQTWLDTILQVYEFSTQYEWENYWVEYRRKLLTWCQHTCKILEYITSIPKLNTELILWEKSKSAVYAHKKTERSLRYDDESFPKTEIASEIKNIEEWHRAVENVLNQTFPKLDDEHAWHVYKLNARDIKAKLSSMQDAFNIICQKTAHFFDVNELIKQEKSTYDYLADLIEFVYDEAYKKQAFTTHLKQDVKAWKEGKRQDIFTNLKIVKDEFESETFFELVLPSNIVYEEGFTKSIVLGINNITPKEFEVFIESIVKGLSGLIELDVDFYYLILIDRDGKAMRRGVKFNHNFFQETIDVLEGRKIEIENIPLPIELEDTHFEQLGNIERVEQQPDDKVKSAIIAIHELLWRFTEIHHQLTTKNVNIQKWLQKLLASIDIKLTQQLSLLKSELEVYQKYETIIQEVRLRERSFDKEACHQYWQEDVVL